ncbi:MAG: hypothetical protein K9K63_07355 [Desulfotignum sp.]|nr:hypothetical protein [Desulfotignum sp.]MCF8137110.1 hypothetical protein [Desulfotignum sp.]
MRSYFLLSAMIVILAGCAASSDPRSGGFFGGVHGLATGTYEERIQEREERLERLRSLQQEIQHDEKELQETRDDLMQIIVEEQIALRDMRNNSEELLTELDRLKTADEHDQVLIAELKGLTAELQKGIQKQQLSLDTLESEGAGGEEAALRLKQLIKQRDELRKEYDLLVELYYELAK